MSGVLVVASLLSVWTFVAVVTGLVLGRMIRMRDLQRSDAPSLRGAGVVGQIRAVCGKHADSLAAGRAVVPPVGVWGN